jgi:hypothetical protein
VAARLAGLLFRGRYVDWIWLLHGRVGCGCWLPFADGALLVVPQLVMIIRLVADERRVYPVGRPVVILVPSFPAFTVGCRLLPLVWPRYGYPRDVWFPGYAFPPLRTRCLVPAWLTVTAWYWLVLIVHWIAHCSRRAYTDIPLPCGWRAVSCNVGADRLVDAVPLLFPVGRRLGAGGYAVVGLNGPFSPHRRCL